MCSLRPTPAVGSVFLDARGDGRALRVSWHSEAGVVVLSVWRDNVCTATVRLPPEDVVGLIETLAAGLARGTDPGLATA
ncbi:hypothetical protein AB3X52_09560 [Nocardioides sp. DS6]|uniref:Uncharacterized protein n=1 Tax=Nocardioides eburneus TaxID=3231482 RepID=A0ABV3SY42_9ACTN